MNNGSCGTCDCGSGSDLVHAPDPTHGAGRRGVDHTTPLGFVFPEEVSARERSFGLYVPSFVADHPVSIDSIDYPSVGTLGELDAALRYMMAIGQNDPSAVLGAGAPLTATITSRALAIGLAIKYTISAEQRAAFDLNIVTANFVSDDFIVAGAAAVDVNRSLTLRVPGACPGGVIYVPFAYDRAGSVPEGRVKAGRSLALLSADAVAAGPIVYGNGTGTVVITGQPGGATTFAFTVKLLMAHDPDTLRFLKLIGYLPGGRR